LTSVPSQDLGVVLGKLLMSPASRVGRRAFRGRPFGPFAAAEIVLGCLVEHRFPPGDLKQLSSKSPLNSG
jgi:hypothetical protein